MDNLNSFLKWIKENISLLQFVIHHKLNKHFQEEVFQFQHENPCQVLCV